MAPVSTLGFVLICTIFVFHFELFEAATEFRIGDIKGWHIIARDLPKGKSFHAGDVLDFSYCINRHSVIVVDATGYNNCTPSPGSTLYPSGVEKVPLVAGNNYFICGIPGQCKAGMKIAIRAT